MRAIDHLLFLSAFVAFFGPGTTQEKGQGGPIRPCEENNQLVADKYSCTRYHVCRQLDGSDEFTTDIAICSPQKVFDMVLSECVDIETGFLQDPSGCTTFYGCHSTKETSEGYLRRHYTCPGFLRFNPEEKYCTFKTNVTDDLCNSRDPDQRIIGDVNRIRLNSNGNSFALRSNNRISTLVDQLSQPGPKKRFANVPSTILSRLNGNILTAGASSQSAASAKVANPIKESSLHTIAQAINSHVLTSLQNRSKQANEGKKPAAKGKEVKKEEKKE